MGSAVGEESIPDLVKSLESAFLPDDFKIVTDKLLAREEKWRRKYEAMKTKVEALTTVGNVLGASSTNTMRSDERTQLKSQITRLTQEKGNLEMENADWKRAYEELERKISQVEKIAMEMKDNCSCNSGRNRDGDVPSQPACSHRIFDDYVYATPKRVPNPGPAAQADGNGNSLETVDSDDDLAVIGDTAAEKPCQKKVAERNSTQTNGENNRKGLIQDGTPLINLCEDENESRGRKLRACSGVSKTDWSSSKSQVDIVVLDEDECQEPALSKSSKKRSSPVMEVPIGRWNSDNDMLSDFTDDDELCMRAVCALYRHQNRKGSSLNTFSSQREASLAEFLTNGDPEGRLKRSIFELHQFSGESVKLCREIAHRHSAELFEMYQKKEDPYFPHS